MTKRRAGELAQPPSEWALRDLPARVVTFLHAAGTHAPLRAALEAGGYSPTDHAEGLRLLVAVCPYRDGGLDPADDTAPRKAVAELERWTKRHVTRLRAALERLHPEALSLLPESSAQGAKAVLVVATLLGRLNELEALEPKSATLATLTRRGLDRALRKRLFELVEVAKRVEAPGVVQLVDASAPDALDAEMVALHRWYEDWSGTARALVERKDWLIRLGVSERRRRAVAPLA